MTFHPIAGGGGGSARRRRGQFARRWTLPIVGGITPVLLIVVNIAAFIVHQLQTFRLLIAILAFISGLMLNSWAGIRVYQYVQRRYPQNHLQEESNQELLIIGGMGVVIIVSAVTAWFCYQGLASDANLPNIWTFLLGVGSIAIPVLIRELFSRGMTKPAEVR